MGIRNLKTYIYKNSHDYLQYYELQNTYLVIDGYNTCYQIFYRHVETYCVFGGDYDVLEKAILKFFNDLLTCNVTPIVVLDGAYESSKLNTILKRHKERYEKALHLAVCDKKDKIPPLFIIEVFKNVLKKKNIRHVQWLFDCDGTIAAVAKILQCPVLSLDSDFYIYGTLYIPFDTLSHFLITSSRNDEKVMSCLIYNPQALLNSFKGLNHRTLSLAAVILGEEHLQTHILQNFFHEHKTLQDYRYRIPNTFKWCSNHTLDEAIVEILRGIPKSMRQQTLNIIESVINNYTCINVPTAVFVKLGIPECTMDSMTIFKFKEDIKNLEFRGNYSEDYLIKIANEGHINRLKNELIEHIKSQNGNNSVINKLPIWFVDEVYSAKIMGNLINIVDKHSVMFPIHIEDFRCPASSLLVLKIVSVIYGLMSSIVDHKTTYMKYLVRDENMNMQWNRLEGTRTISLSSLRELPIMTRKDILDNTLGIKNMKCIDELLPQWKLYIACIRYWSDQEKLYKSDKYYAYSIIICILRNIFDATKFPRNNVHMRNCKPNYSANITIAEAYENIDVMNCTSATQFFNCHSQIQNRLLYLNKVNMSIVHAFSQFQICLMYAMDLNALLGYPYENPIIAELFNGTVVYNVYTELKACKDVNKHLNEVFKTSPTFLVMINVLISKINPLLM